MQFIAAGQRHGADNSWGVCAGLDADEGLGDVGECRRVVLGIDVGVDACPVQSYGSCGLMAGEERRGVLSRAFSLPICSMTCGYTHVVWKPASTTTTARCNHKYKYNNKYNCIDNDNYIYICNYNFNYNYNCINNCINNNDDNDIDNDTDDTVWPFCRSG